MPLLHVNNSCSNININNTINIKASVETTSLTLNTTAVTQYLNINRSSDNIKINISSGRRRRRWRSRRNGRSKKVKEAP